MVMDPLSITIAVALAAAQPPQSPAPPFEVPASQVVDLPASLNGVAYQLYVHVPSQCGSAEQRICRVVYMLDAEYSFGLAALIGTHLADRGQSPPFISVAVGFRDKSQYRLNRTRDYTPYHHPTGGYGNEMQRMSGGGPAFLEFLQRQVVPFVEARFPASAEGRTLVGHSYGGLFATYAWMSAPELFENYIIVSPSLWYADGRPLRDLERTCASGALTGERSMFLAVGDHEEQPENGRAMVSDLRRMHEILGRCSARRVSSALRVYEDETHASIFPAALSTGIRVLFQ